MNEMMVASKRKTDVDPLWANVVMLLNMDGAAGSSVFVEKAKGRIVTKAGTPTVDGNNGLVLNGSSGLTVPSSADFQFPGNCCWEYWITTNYAGTHDHLNCGPMSFDGATVDRWSVLQTGTQFQTYPKNFIYNGITNMVSAVRNHIAVFRIDQLFYIALDGFVRSYSTNAFPGVVGNQTFPLSVGCRSGNNSFTVGTMGPVRITKDNSRYGTANFIPPKFGPFPTK